MASRIFVYCLLLSYAAICGCGSATSTDLVDVCKRPIGSYVEVNGYISIPKETTILQHMRNGEIGDIGIQLLISADKGGAGDSVMATFWTSTTEQPNKVKGVVTNGYVSTDLLFYLDDGRTTDAGNLVRLSGKTVSDERSGCYVNIDRITMIP